MILAYSVISKFTYKIKKKFFVSCLVSNKSVMFVCLNSNKILDME